MSVLYYSKTTRGFYPQSFAGQKPADVVQITEAQWRALLQGQAQGQEIKPDANGLPVLADPPAASVPYSVTPFQAKAAIYAAGLLPAVEAAIAGAPKVAQLAWSDATEFTRDSPTIAALSAQLGLSSAQVDALFVAAAAIEA